MSCSASPEVDQTLALGAVKALPRRTQGPHRRDGKRDSRMAPPLSTLLIPTSASHSFHSPPTTEETLQEFWPETWPTLKQIV